MRWSVLCPSVEVAFSSCTFELQTTWRWLKPSMCQQSPSFTAANIFHPILSKTCTLLGFLLYLYLTQIGTAVVLVLLCPHDSVSWWWWWWLSELGLAALRWRWSCLLYISALPIRAVYVRVCVCVCNCVIVASSWPLEHPPREGEPSRVLRFRVSGCAREPIPVPITRITRIVQPCRQQQ